MRRKREKQKLLSVFTGVTFVTILLLQTFFQSLKYHRKIHGNLLADYRRVVEISAQKKLIVANLALFSNEEMRFQKETAAFERLFISREATEGHVKGTLPSWLAVMESFVIQKPEKNGETISPFLKRTPFEIRVRLASGFTPFSFHRWGDQLPLNLAFSAEGIERQDRTLTIQGDFVTVVPDQSVQRLRYRFFSPKPTTTWETLLHGFPLPGLPRVNRNLYTAIEREKDDWRNLDVLMGTTGRVLDDQERYEALRQEIDSLRQRRKNPALWKF